MLKWLQLTIDQWGLLAQAFSNIAQAIILFSLAALFVPEVVNLNNYFSRSLAILYLFSGLLILTIAVIIKSRGK